ncbi:MAG TPA: glycosyltransferase [bacterium]|nr:glycosyltransferase [bacterium]
MNAFEDKKVSVILYYSEKLPYGDDGFKKVVESIEKQKPQPVDIIVLKQEKDSDIKTEIDNLKLIEDFETVSKGLKKAVQSAAGDFVVYIDNQQYEVLLKQSYLETAFMVMERSSNLGMLYADYELESDGEVQEQHLLKHHIGRVRDNQDFGSALFFPKKALKEAIDTSVKYKPLYDIRLKVSENYDLVHISNRYDGSLYRVIAPATEENVFDYLMDSEESQKEAEKIVSDHLKRIGAYLEPGDHYQKREVGDAELTATVVIPVNDRPQFIGTALESVLNQTVQDIEALVVVNGGETDPTVDEVKKYMAGGEKYDSEKPEVRLKVLDVNNIGLCLNMGAELARGKYYVQLDSDDRLKPDAVEKVVKKFESDPEIGMVIGSYEVWELQSSGEYNRMEDIPVVTHDEWTQENGRNNLLRINGAGAPRCIPFDIIKEVGYFDMNDMPFARNYGEDYDMVMKISEKYKVGRIFDPIYEVVRHAGGTDHAIDQLTVNRNNEAKDHMRLKGIKRRIELNKNK